MRRMRERHELGRPWDRQRCRAAELFHRVFHDNSTYGAWVRDPSGDAMLRIRVYRFGLSGGGSSFGVHRVGAWRGEVSLRSLGIGLSPTRQPVTADTGDGHDAQATGTEGNRIE